MADELAAHAKALQEQLIRMGNSEQYPEWRLHYAEDPYTAETVARLGQIEHAASEWAAAKTQVYRPSDPTAARTYFVHNLARSFNRRYASPRPGLIAKLTNVFFPGNALERKQVENLLKDRS